jgi:hypothetical protein
MKIPQRKREFHGHDEAFYWATHNGAELDLLLFKDGRRIGIECKRANAPVLTASMRIALADLKLDRLCILYPGEKHYQSRPFLERLKPPVVASEVSRATLGWPVPVLISSGR